MGVDDAARFVPDGDADAMVPLEALSVGDVGDVDDLDEEEEENEAAMAVAATRFETPKVNTSVLSPSLLNTTSGCCSITFPSGDMAFSPTNSASISASVSASVSTTVFASAVGSNTSDASKIGGIASIKLTSATNCS